MMVQHFAVSVRFHVSTLILLLLTEAILSDAFFIQSIRLSRSVRNVVATTRKNDVTRRCDFCRTGMNRNLLERAMERRQLSDEARSTSMDRYNDRSGNRRPSQDNSHNKNRRNGQQWATTERNDQHVHSYYLATCLPGMVNILRDELCELGCVSVEASGTSAVAFGVPQLKIALQVLLWCRTAHKIMELLTETTTVPVADREELYQFIRNAVPVNDLLLRNQDIQNNDSAEMPPKIESWLTLSVHVTLNNPHYIPDDINHSHYTALTIKNALVDAARTTSGARPSVDTSDAVDVPLVAVLRGVLTGEDRTAHVSLYRCLHTGSLHRRGYRFGTAIHKAALKESTAAGLLRAAGWHQYCQTAMDQGENIILLDPMMGSGTLILEAALIAADVAPGLMRLKCGIPYSRVPPVVRWNHHDEREENIHENNVVDLWNDLLVAAAQRARLGLHRLVSNDTQVQIWGNDIHDGAVELARHAIQQAGLRQVVSIRQGNCANWSMLENDSTIGTNSSSYCRCLVVTNPPWGVRLTDDMHDSWESLRVFLREHCPKGMTEAWVLSGSPSATKHLGLRRSASLPFKTGQQDLRWLQYRIHGVDDDNDKDKNQNEKIIARNEWTSRTDIRGKTMTIKRKTMNEAMSGTPIKKLASSTSPQTDDRDSKRLPSKSKKSVLFDANDENEWLI